MISAPLLDNLIERAQMHPDLLVQTDKEHLLKIIDHLQCVAICGDDEYRELWFTVERGSIEEFGDYDDYLENEMVENREDFEELWKAYYPDPVKWYLFSVSRYNEEYFIGIDNKFTLHIKKESPDIQESIHGQLISLID
ncbi:hypothetical protein [Proteiniphilum sp.]|uniref:hypothetical protein n=1 Tax=Proteiniphilum sp. TaxID=1926877 RepID=UPI003330B210